MGLPTRAPKSTLDEDALGGRYVVSGEDANGPDGFWFYVWVEPQQ